jgi:hypothetical protein
MMLLKPVTQASEGRELGLNAIAKTLEDSKKEVPVVVDLAKGLLDHPQILQRSP